MAVIRVPGSTARINTVLAQLFQAHGVEAVHDGSVLRFPAHPGLWMNGEAFNPLERAGQLDFRLGIEPNRLLCESVAGMGRTPDTQIDDGLAAFASHSFHVLLCAFFGVPPDHGICREEWDIDERKRVVFIGTIGSRFGFPLDGSGKPEIRFFVEFTRRLKVQPMPSGTHWVRLYQMRRGGRVLANEVLLDNQPWAELQDAMAAFDWPLCDNTYDVRVFLVIRDSE